MPTAFWGQMRKATGAGVNDPNGVDCAKRYSAVTFTPNHYSQIVLASVPSGGQLYFHYCNVRMDTAGNLYQVTTAADIGPSTLELFRVSSAGAFTKIGTNITLGANMAAGDVMRLSAAGTTLTVTYNGVIVRTATDATFATGQPGIGGWSQTAASDVPFIASWSAADLVRSDLRPSRMHAALFQM
ncbi:MAG TPA: hypothetical protein VFD36_00455 [Kofleriaceae bacterium]|nr:hypothetical protein [Kofleriaceae bacterium]